MLRCSVFPLPECSPFTDDSVPEGAPFWMGWFQCWCICCCIIERWLICLAQIGPLPGFWQPNYHVSWHLSWKWGLFISRILGLSFWLIIEKTVAKTNVSWFDFHHIALVMILFYLINMYFVPVWTVIICIPDTRNNSSWRSCSQPRRDFCYVEEHSSFTGILFCVSWWLYLLKLYACFSLNSVANACAYLQV